VATVQAYFILRLPQAITIHITSKSLSMQEKKKQLIIALF
jgi:hypothetical protein